MTHLASITARSPGHTVFLTLILCGWANLPVTTTYRTVAQLFILKWLVSLFLRPSRACISITVTRNLHNCQSRAAGPPGTTHSRSHSSCACRDATDANFSPPTLSRRVHPQSSWVFLPHLLCWSSEKPICYGTADGRSPGPGMRQGHELRDRQQSLFFPGPAHSILYTEVHAILCCGSCQVSGTEASVPHVHS